MRCERCGHDNYSYLSEIDAAEAVRMGFRGLQQLLVIEEATVIDPQNAVIVLLRLLTAPLDEYAGPDKH